MSVIILSMTEYLWEEMTKWNQIENWWNCFLTGRLSAEDGLCEPMTFWPVYLISGPVTIWWYQEKKRKGCPWLTCELYQAKTGDFSVGMSRVPGLLRDKEWTNSWSDSFMATLSCSGNWRELDFDCPLHRLSHFHRLKTTTLIYFSCPLFSVSDTQSLFADKLKGH